MLTPNDRLLLDGSGLPRRVFNDLIELGSLTTIHTSFNLAFKDPIYYFGILERKAIFSVIEEVKSLQLSEGALKGIEEAYCNLQEYLLNKEFGFSLLENPETFYNKTMAQCTVDMQNSVNLETLGKRISAIIKFHSHYFEALFALLTRKYFSNIQG